MKRTAAILGIFLLVMGLARAYEANMFIFAVTDTGQGVPATLTVSVTPGNGNIAIDLGKSIVGESTQESVRDAIAAATHYLDVNKDEYDFFVKIDSPAEKIDGPSAGLAIALATYAALQGKDVPDYISATGQIDADGTVYPVGGIYGKAKAAHDVGVKIFLIPAGERNTTAEIEEEVEPGIVQTVVKNIDIVAYAKEHWGMDIYEVSDLNQAIQIVFEGKRPENNVPAKSPSEEMDNFTPPAAPVSKSSEFKDLAEELVQSARREITKAQSCSLTLKDASIEQALRDSLKTADSMARRAAALVDLGYYYTAANYAFLAKIDAETYRLVCEHPSLLNPSSTAFQDLMQDTDGRISALQQNLSEVNVNKNNVEWIGAARDRFIRAKSSFDALKTAPLTGADPIYLRQIISVREWLDSAEEMYKKGRKIEGPQLSDLQKLAKQAIISVEDIQEMVNIDDPSVAERIHWARDAYEMGWYYTAAIEAASARGLAMGTVIAKRGDPISALAERFSDPFKPEGIWDELYENHARYYYEAAKYYKRSGKEEKAKEMAKTGLQIYEMAAEVQKINKAIYSAPVVTVSVQKKATALQDNEKLAMVAATVLVASLLLLVLLIITGRREERKGHHEQLMKEHEYRRKIMETEHMIQEIKKRLKKNPDDRDLKKELAKYKRLLGRYKKLLDKIKEQGA